MQMKNKKDFELDLLLAVDELLNELNVCFGGIPILLEMKEREYFQDAKDDETIHGLIERYNNNYKGLGLSKIFMNKIEEFNVDEFLNKVTETKRIFRQSLEKYGKEPQCRQTMEECAELIQAINKFLRYPNDKHYANLIEEIADVEIMLYQLKVMFNIDDDQVLAFKVEKAKREQERLEKL